MIHVNLFKSAIQLFVLSGLLFVSFLANAEELIPDKRIEIAMRSIGHELLASTGDCSSRVLAIEQRANRFIISFEEKLSFDPGQLVSIVKMVMQETAVSDNYFVEVIHEPSGEAVHSFEVTAPDNPFLIPCSGRVLPMDRYHLELGLRGSNQAIASFTNNKPGSNIAFPNTYPENVRVKRGNESSAVLHGNSSWILILALIIILSGSYFFAKKRRAEKDPNTIILGSAKFDKKNMRLSVTDKTVELSQKEADLLSLLCDSANEPIDRDQILQKVWGDEGDYIGRTLDVFVSKLRKKLSVDKSVKIINIRGYGYKLITDISP